MNLQFHTKSHFTLARAITALAWSAAVLGVALTLGGLLFLYLNRRTPLAVAMFYPSEMVVGLVFGSIGALVVAHIPRNLLGWIFLVISLPAACSFFGAQYHYYTSLTRPGALPVIYALVWLKAWIWAVSFSSIGLLPLFFPTGRLLSPRWRWVLWLVLGSAGLFTGLLIGITWGRSIEALLNVNDSMASPIQLILLNASLSGLALGYLGSALALLVRFYRARGVERQQLKWFSFAVALLAAALVASTVSGNLWPNPTLSSAFEILQTVAAAGIAVAVGIAILKHRLFDIDIIIRRTFSYTILTVALALVYFGSVVLLQQLLRPFVGRAETPLVTVASTLALAALFTPLRRRVQTVIDHCFYRRKYDAAQVLAAFSETVRNETDLDKLSERLVAVVQKTLQPTQVHLWFKRTEKSNANF